jgi:DNA-binding transcriptional LysR family regulator
LVVACAPGHHLAGRHDLPLTKVNDETFIDLSIVRSVVRHVAFEVADLSTVLALAKRGLGIALVREAIAKTPLRFSSALSLAFLDLLAETEETRVVKSADPRSATA